MSTRINVPTIDLGTGQAGDSLGLVARRSVVVPDGEDLGRRLCDALATAHGRAAETVISEEADAVVIEAGEEVRAAIRRMIAAGVAAEEIPAVLAATDEDHFYDLRARLTQRLENRASSAHPSRPLARAEVSVLQSAVHSD